MRYLLPLLLLPALLWGAKVLSYNVYDRNDRVDVMLTFDTPYEGVLRQNRQGDTVIVKLEEAFIEAPKLKDVNSKYLGKLSIAPQGDNIEITAQVSNDVTMQASKTSDSYGLRLRFMHPVVSDIPEVIPPVDETAVEGLPTKSDSEFEQSYYVVIAILLIGIGILFWLKQNIAKRAETIHSEPKTPWLFNKFSSEAKSSPAAPIKTSTDMGGVHIRFQKTLDPAHTVAMLDYGTMSYLVLLGNNTLLLDKFQDNIPITQNEFESLLQSKHRELDGYFQLAPAQDEAFDSYKEKASGVY
ncbi:MULTISPECIES: hypothetical protein [unclassified Sulfuricurvum]|uniref:hypothetical protein n=1 Tax=unclassified Sulfuricurvum TaxID=2632390 RepID=UPI0002999F1C|nr:MULTISPECIES: hypothetical protein [unclassified Sulfuricurvum]AFV97267.1 hypothetical protein B649_04765 [Candidatus Sulfuricurvum sp. RIFRC-1]OHD85754.1 MAG: hypothetical protein A3I60_03670 [Sulfuricurvum sp. RIFCSPLOWO2_02_FULL_43_45]OHD88401.1 MAG: hypothetical protein A3G19_10915 [Sulfuricurvum sp. RIFCSPLOWO2_12_FULL_43_24]HBM34916.1 hypothetical protein [Sulfuricurvum sp.]